MKVTGLNTKLLFMKNYVHLNLRAYSNKVGNIFVIEISF